MGDSWAERVVDALRAAPAPLNDDKLAAQLGGAQRQTINQVCRRLQASGVVVRRPGRPAK